MPYNTCKKKSTIIMIPRAIFRYLKITMGVALNAVRFKRKCIIRFKKKLPSAEIAYWTLKLSKEFIN